MLLFHCRAGFEADCAAEVAAAARSAAAPGRSEYRSGEAHVLWHADQGTGRRRDWVPEYADLVFARQILTQCHVLEAAPADRLDAIVDSVRSLKRRYATVWLEAPDADAPRQLLAGARGLLEPLQVALREAGVLTARSGQRLHVCLLDRHRVLLGASDPGNSAPWPMGIPRLRFPANAPSRSGLKLVEALALFIGEEDLHGRMRAGRVAIDLGAAPGGWSQVLASRGVRVVAVDTGPTPSRICSRAR